MRRLLGQYVIAAPCCGCGAFAAVTRVHVVPSHSQVSLNRPAAAPAKITALCRAGHAPRSHPTRLWRMAVQRALPLAPFVQKLPNSKRTPLELVTASRPATTSPIRVWE